MGVVSGLCGICQAPGAIHTCSLCGTLVCHRHYLHGRNACTRHGGQGGRSDEPSGGGVGPSPGTPQPPPGRM